MSYMGSQSFRQYAEVYKRICALETELAQELAVQREQFRASLLPDEASASRANLSNVYSLHRQRSAFGS